MSIARASLIQLTVAVVLGAVLAVGSMDAARGAAEAQCTSTTTGVEGCGPVRALPKATIGLGLVGAELGLIVPAVAGLRDWYWYLIFPVVGAAGGAVGGYFLDVEMGRSNSPEVSVALMAIGMALVVPTVIGTLALTAYSPPAESSQADEDMQYEEQGDSVEAVQDGGGGGGETQTEASPQAQRSLDQRIRALYAGGPGLVRFHQGQLLLAPPIVASMGTYTREELERLNLAQQADVVVPLVSASF